jgi:hypothetical protein
LSGKKIVGTMQWLALMVILITMVLVAVYGYKTSVSTQSKTNTQRKELSYISNKIHEMDVKDGVSIRENEFGDVLVLTDRAGEDVYETRIYLNVGKLYEEYSESSAELNPHSANIISNTKKFDLSMEDGLIRLETDSGKTYVLLRTEN